MHRCRRKPGSLCHRTPYAVRRRSSKDLLLTAGCTRLLGSSSVCFGPLIEDLYSGGKRPHGGGGSGALVGAAEDCGGAAASNGS